MTYGKAAPDYIDLGWDTPLPLPMMHKYPPPEHSTGNYPDVEETTLEAWMFEREDWNIGLRMPTFAKDADKYEVVGIDVDHYGDKNGWDTIAALSDRLGPLPDTFKSSARGANSPSGIYFFVVPAGRKWSGQVGANVELIQRTHRYAVVWPSAVKDKKTKAVRRYSWYRVEDDEAVVVRKPPSVKELPELPRAWQDHLAKGFAEERRITDPDPELGTMKAVREWMKKNLPGYDKQPSSEMAAASHLETLAAEATGGAHEMLVTRSHRVIMLAAEGHHGCLAALESIQTAFYDEVLGKHSGDARRSLDEARREFNRAIAQEIEKLKADVDGGYIVISKVGGFTADDVNVDTSVVLRQLLKRRNSVVDADDYDDNDIGRGKMFLDSTEDTVRPILHSDEWLLWNDVTKRSEVIQKGQLAEPWENTVVASLKKTADKAYELAERQDEAGQDEAKETRKKANDMARRARVAGNKAVMNPSLDMAHTLSRRGINRAEFDQDPMKLGVANGVLDFHQGVEEKLLREGTFDDMILMNTEVRYRPEAKHPLWESFLQTFLPDEDYRHFVQRAFGYGLLGRNPLRLIVFLQGGTSTGKSTILRAVENALGGYASTIQANALFREKQDAGPAPEIITAIPKRMVFASEVGIHNRLHADVIKRLTGGDPLSARALYSNQVVTQVPMFTPYIATNSMPTITDGDDALWRRLLVLPFDHSVDPDTVPRQAIESVPEALEAVLAWLVEGLLDYLEFGLKREDWPKQITSRMAKFVEGTSDFQQFLSSTVVKESDGRVEAEKLYQAYRTWGLQEGMRESDLFTKNKFTRSMDSNGFRKLDTSKRVEGRVKKTSFYTGVRMKK